MATPANVRYDFYQTASDVTARLLHPNHRSKEVNVKFASNSIDVSVQFEGCDEGYSLHIDLFSSIVHDQCSWKTFPTRVEIKMKKAVAVNWPKLEGEPPAVAAAKDSAAEGEIPVYPTSSLKKTNWDKVVTDYDKIEAEEEKKDQGESAVNRLFQQIYSQGSEEVQRAMNKSFAESGGTVLSTNWKEVGEKQVEVKPPDGMEFKSWN